MTHEYEQVPPSYLEQHRCVNCHKEYRDLENTGRLRCRMHPGLVSLEADGLYHYQCCGAVSGRGVVGCVRADHMEARTTVTQDQQARLDELADWGTCVVPTALFQYGVQRPLSECLLGHDSGEPCNTDKGAEILHYRFLFDSVEKEARQCDISEQRRLLRETVPTVPLLASLYCQSNKQESRRAMMEEIDEGWRETLDKAGGGDMKGDASTTTLSRINEQDRLIVPFVVIGRFQPAPYQ